MAGTTNILQWNPTAANQETDSEYLADSQRAGGATNPSVFEAELANKLFFQCTTYVAALFQAFANKGFTTSDSNLSTLTAQCANFLTSADIKPAQVQVPFSPNPVFDCNLANGFRIDLSGNVTSSTLVNAPPSGSVITFYIVSNSPGNYSFAWPGNVLFARNVKTESQGNLLTEQFISDGTNLYPAENFLNTLSGLTAAAQNSANTALAQIAALNFAATLASNGSQSLPSGLIIKWATGNQDHGVNTNPVQTVGFASNFPNSCFAAYVSTNFFSGASNDIQMYSVSSYNNAGVTVIRQRRGDESEDYVTSPTVFAFGR
jgi:hypothetical protein